MEYHSLTCVPAVVGSFLSLAFPRDEQAKANEGQPSLRVLPAPAPWGALGWHLRVSLSPGVNVQ